MNNFDQSSSGINLNLSAFKDTMQSQILFSENFERDRYIDDYFHYTSYGENDVIDLLCLENYSLTKKDIITCMFSFENEDWIRDNYNGSFSKATKADLIEYWDQYISGGFSSNDIINYYIENFKPKFEILTVTGYCQGDQAEVIFSHDAMKDYNFECRSKFLNDMCEYFKNLFYNAPIYARLEIETDNATDEIYLEEALEDLYTWDSDRVIDYVKNNCLQNYTQGQKTYILEWLEDNLQTDLDYI